MFSVAEIEVVGGVFPTRGHFEAACAEAGRVCRRNFAGLDGHVPLMRMHGACAYLDAYSERMWERPDKLASVLVQGPIAPDSVGPLTPADLLFEAALAHFDADLDLAWEDFDLRMGWDE